MIDFYRISLTRKCWSFEALKIISLNGVHSSTAVPLIEDLLLMNFLWTMLNALDSIRYFIRGNVATGTVQLQILIIVAHRCRHEISMQQVILICHMVSK